jgi:hypothetical protein
MTAGDGTGSSRSDSSQEIFVYVRSDGCRICLPVEEYERLLMQDGHGDERGDVQPFDPNELEDMKIPDCLQKSS